MYMRVCDAAWAPSSGVASAYANITMSMICRANALWRTQQCLRVKAGRVGATKGGKSSITKPGRVGNTRAYASLPQVGKIFSLGLLHRLQRSRE